MSSNYKGCDKIVPSPPPSSHEAKKRWRKRVLLVIICSTIFLVAVIHVGIQLTLDRKYGRNSILSSDPIRKICNATSDYDFCISAFSSYPGFLMRANMSELARISVEVSRDEAIRVADFVVELNFTSVDKSHGALEYCTKLLNDTVDLLNSSVSVLTEQSWKQKIADLRRLLSAALTYPSTCVDGFEDVDLNMNESMKQNVERVTDLVNNALAIVFFVSNSEKSIKNDRQILLFNPF